MAEGHGEVALGGRGHHVDGGRGAGVDGEQLVVGHHAAVLEALARGQRLPQVADLRVADDRLVAQHQQLALPTLAELGHRPSQGFGGIDPGPGDPAHHEHGAAGLATGRALGGHQGHHRAEGVAAQVHAGQGQQAQEVVTLPVIREQEEVPGADGAQGVDGLDAGGVLELGLQHARGVEIHHHGQAGGLELGGLLGLDDQQHVRPDTLDVGAQLGPGGEAGGPTGDDVLSPGDAVDVVTGGLQGLGVVPGAQGAPGDRATWGGKPAVEDEQDTH